MKRNFSFFKGLATATLIFVLVMLWWSSLLIEKDIKTLTFQMEALTKKVNHLPSRIQHIAINQVHTSRPEEGRPHIKAQYDNLLSEDLFFSKTLPEQLPADFEPHGTRRETILGRPENLHPFNGFATVSSMINMCSVSVAQLQFGKYETMAPDMAIKLEKREVAGSPQIFEYWIHLRDHVYWQPLHPHHFPQDFELSDHFQKKHKVTAHDFKFFYDAVMNPHISEAKAAALRSYYNDIEEFRVIDDLTFVVRWKQDEIVDELGNRVPTAKYSAQGLTGALQPLASFVFQYFSDGQKIVDDDSDPDTYRTHSVWAQNFSQHWAKNCIVSCGPWHFDKINDEKIIFRRNPDYYVPYLILVDRLVYTFKESVEAVWQDFKSGKSDLCQLTPNQLIELENFLVSEEYKRQEKEKFAIKRIDYVAKSYYYLGWNQHKPFFKNVKVRRAMTMAIDRNRIISQNLNEMGVAITGPFFRYSPAYDASIDEWSYNPDQARQNLDEEGWVDIDGDGIRDKIFDGQTVAFRFTLAYYVKSHASKSIAEYIKGQLREVGIACQLKGLDLPDLSRQFEDKTFDAIYMGWKLGAPPEDPKQLWHSDGATMKGSSNAIGFNNATVDGLIERLSYESNQERRVELYHNFHKIIHENAPYTFLYSPKVRLLYRENVKNLFIPSQREDLVPGANMTEPDLRIIYFDK